MKRSNKRKSFVDPVGMNGSNFKNETLFLSFIRLSLQSELGEMAFYSLCSYPVVSMLFSICCYYVYNCMRLELKTYLEHKVDVGHLLGRPSSIRSLKKSIKVVISNITESITLYYSADLIFLYVYKNENTRIHISQRSISPKDSYHPNRKYKQSGDVKKR